MSSEKKEGGKGFSLGGLINGIFKDNINIAILAGLIMSGTGTAVKDLKFVGSAIDTMAAAQSPVLFLLIGLTVQLKGNTPLVSWCVRRVILTSGL